MKKINKFSFGLLGGILLPVAFIWLYINSLYPSGLDFFQIIKQLYPSATLGKLLMLSYVPDMACVFACYKFDLFRIASGFMVGGMPYFVASFFML
jgi:hypothetical protein